MILICIVTIKSWIEIASSLLRLEEELLNIPIEEKKIAKIEKRKINKPFWELIKHKSLRYLLMLLQY